MFIIEAILAVLEKLFGLRFIGKSDDPLSPDDQFDLA